MVGFESSCTDSANEALVLYFHLHCFCVNYCPKSNKVRPYQTEGYNLKSTLWKALITLIVHNAIDPTVRTYTAIRCKDLYLTATEVCRVTRADDLDPGYHCDGRESADRMEKQRPPNPEGICARK